MIIEISVLTLILVIVIIGIWRQKRFAVLNIKMYQDVTIKLSQDYIKKLSEVEGRILREVVKNQKMQLELTQKVRSISDEVKTIQAEQAKNLQSITEKLETMDNRITDMTKLIKENDK